MKEGGREEYSSKVRVNPVCFLLILYILKVHELFIFHQRRKEERIIPAASELIRYSYVSYLYSTY
jgi:hypothetical protein